MFDFFVEGSKLTTAALLRHDASFGVGGKLTASDIDAADGDEKMKDVTEMTHKTFDTFASDWSGCTNVAFEKVLQKFKASRSGDKVFINSMNSMCLKGKCVSTCVKALLIL